MRLRRRVCSEEVLSLLRDENEYTEAQTSHLDAVRTELYDELLSHIQEVALPLVARCRTRLLAPTLVTERRSHAPRHAG